METAFEKNIHALERDLRRYIIRNPEMLTKPGETCFYQCPASVIRLRSVPGGGAVNSAVIANRNSISQLYRSGQFAVSSGAHRRVAEKYPGNFFLTNQRLLMLTAPYGFDLPLTDIFIINFYSDGFAIMARGKTYMLETLHANRIQEFLKQNMVYISYYKELADKLSHTAYTDPLHIHKTLPEDAFDFQKLKLSLDLLCGIKTPVAAVAELTPPRPKPDPEIEAKIEKKMHKSIQRRTLDVLLWLLALFLAFYFAFPFLMEVEWSDIRNIFNGGGSDFTVIAGEMTEIVADEPQDLENLGAQDLGGAAPNTP